MDYSGSSAEELVKACAEQENAEAWEEFVRRFHKLIGVVVRRIAHRWGHADGRVIEDLIQDTYLKVCANNCRLLREFEARHPDAFFGMLKVTAANVAHDYFRSRHSLTRGYGLAELEISEIEAFVPDGRSFGAAQIERKILLEQIDRILATMSYPLAARDREVFWLYYRQGLTADAIAGIACFQLTVKGVESILHRLRQYVRQSLAEESMDPTDARAAAKGIPGQNPLKKGEGQS